MRKRAQKYIKFGCATDKNVDQLRKLNLALFPVRYNNKFYTDLATASTQAYTHLAYFNDILVGAICCRIEPQEHPAFKLYIMTIGVLAPYRRLGIGTQLLRQVRAVVMAAVAVRRWRLLPPRARLRRHAARLHPTRPSQVLHACALEPNLQQLYLHVQTSNHDSLEFYKRFGFTTGEVVKDYYKRIEPPDAVLLHRVAPFPVLPKEEQPARYA